MENQLISLKEESPKNYKVYWGDRVVGTIVDGLKLFGLKDYSSCEVIISAKDYRLNCNRKSTAPIGVSSNYYSCELLSLDNKKIAEFQVDLNLWGYRIWDAFVTLTNKINYLEYYKDSSNLSIWNDENTTKISEYRKGSFKLSDGYTLKDPEDLNLIIMTTALIEKFMYKKLKRDSGYFVAMLVVLGIFAVFGIVIYLKFK